MTVLKSGDQDEVFLPAQQILTVTAQHGTARVTRIDVPEFQNIANGATVEIGPFNSGSNHRIEALTGSAQYSIDKADFPTEDEARSGLVSGTGVSAVVKLTQAAYDALDPPDTATLYVIVG